MVLQRLGQQPLPRYGGGAAQYIEHAYRLEQVVLYRSQSWGNVRDFLVAADIEEGFPPMMHSLAGIAGSVFGHRIEDLQWLGLFWLAVLAASVAWTALSLTGRRDVAAAALVGGFLLPAGHGFAMRYYYDLPAASLLWLGLAVFVAGEDRRPVISGFVSGVLVWVAGCVKWSMLPYAALAFPFALLVRGPGAIRPLRRVLALVVAGGVAGLMMWAWIDGGGGSHMESLASRSSSTGVWEQRVAWLPLPLQAVAARGFWELTHPDFYRLLWYPLAFVVSVLSPLWTLAIAPLLVVALRRRPSGWLLPFGLLISVGAFLSFNIAVRDERFAIALAAGLVLLGALGWGALGERSRVLIGRVVIATGLLVAADFHFGAPAFWNQPVEVFSGRGVIPAPRALPPLTARGLGLADSVEQRGWSRADRTPNGDLEYLEQIWASVERCGGPSLALAEHVMPNGSIPWLEYRAALSYVSGGGWDTPQIDVLWSFPGEENVNEPPPEDADSDEAPQAQGPPRTPPEVGIARLKGEGLPGEGWSLMSRHLHPEMEEYGPWVGVFARGNAACLK